MEKIIIFGKYELSQNGEIKNITTGKELKVEKTTNGRVAKLYIDGKTKRVNIDDMILENFNQIKIEGEINMENVNTNLNEVTVEKVEKVKKPKATKIIRVTQLDGKVLEFKTFKEANDHYGLRKDYLNYCLTEKFNHMLTKNDLQLLKVEKIVLEKAEIIEEEIVENVEENIVEENIVE